MVTFPIDGVEKVRCVVAANALGPKEALRFFPSSSPSPSSSSPPSSFKNCFDCPGASERRSLRLLPKWMLGANRAVFVHCFWYQFHSHCSSLFDSGDRMLQVPAATWDNPEEPGRMDGSELVA